MAVSVFDGGTILDNPTGSAFTSLADDGRRYLIVNTVVGDFRRGAVVAAKDLGPGAQITRLLASSAIGELSPANAALAAADPAVIALSRPVSQGLFVDVKNPVPSRSTGG